MSRRPNHPGFPLETQIQLPLLFLVWEYGGPLHALLARDTYEPLADFFRLNKEQRIVTRNAYSRDGRNEPYWHTWVQNAARRLIKNGNLYRPWKGLWLLTERGQRIAGQVSPQRKTPMLRAFERYNYERVTAAALSPPRTLTLEDLGL